MYSSSKLPVNMISEILLQKCLDLRFNFMFNYFEREINNFFFKKKFDPFELTRIEFCLLEQNSNTFGFGITFLFVFRSSFFLQNVFHSVFHEQITKFSMSEFVLIPLQPMLRHRWCRVKLVCAVCTMYMFRYACVRHILIYTFDISISRYDILRGKLLFTHFKQFFNAYAHNFGNAVYIN